MYKRVLLKFSGEALAGESKTGIDQNIMDRICDSVRQLHDLGAEIGIVVGGGNFWRGKYAPNMERASTDYMGMLATIMNGLALQDSLEKRGLETRVQTSLELQQLAEPFIQRKAMKHLSKGRIVIFAGGTGSPYFSTDTAAALRAAEIKANAILVAKTIDGVYTSDPKTDPNAKIISHITCREYLDRNLKIMDATAISLCRDNNIPLVIFAMSNPDNIIKAINGENVGTIIDNIED